MGRARGARERVLGSARACRKRMGRRRRWIGDAVEKNARRSMPAGFAGSRSMLPLCCLPVGSPGHESMLVRGPTRATTARVARHTWESAVVCGPLPRPRGKKAVAAVRRSYVLRKKRQKAAAELPREKARLAGPKPSRLASPSATHGRAEQRQNTPGQVSEHGLVNPRPARLASSGAVLCRWASRPTAAPPQLWGRRAAANGLLTRGTRADGGTARAREARPGPELRPGQ